MCSQSPQDLPIDHVELLTVLMPLPRDVSADQRKSQVTGKISRAKSCMVLARFAGGACVQLLIETRQGVDQEPPCEDIEAAVSRQIRPHRPNSCQAAVPHLPMRP
jgi:hypothetical protein